MEDFLALSIAEQVAITNALMKKRGNAIYGLRGLARHYEDGERAAKQKLKRVPRKPVKVDRGREIHRLFKEEGFQKRDGTPDWIRIRDRLDNDGRQSVSVRVKKTGKLVDTKTLENDHLKYLHSLRKRLPSSQ